MTEHSLLPPSSAARRVACPGSQALEAKYPREESDASRQGSAAHWVAAWRLTHHDDYLFPANAPNGEVINEEMIEGADLYARTIREISGTVPVHIEERIDISVIHSLCWGTPDAWVRIGNEIHIWDYKFGYGYVDVFENWQLIEYAAGILSGVNGLHDQHTHVNFCIVQPRSYHRDGSVRHWRIKASDLRGYFNILEASEAEAAQPIAECRPNPECTNCRGRHACDALQRSSLSAAQITSQNMPHGLWPESLGRELRYLKYIAALLDARITGLEEQAISMIRTGDRVPFFRLEQSLGRERWNVDAEQIITLGEMFGIELAKPLEAITPKQAIKAGIQPEIIERYIERPRGALKLVSDDSAHKIFKG